MSCRLKYLGMISDCCLMFNGKPLSGGLLVESGVCDNARITMNARLRGGKTNSVPGAWFCPTCSQGGWWPARKSCFRCGQSRPAQDGVPITPARPSTRRKNVVFS